MKERVSLMIRKIMRFVTDSDYRFVTLDRRGFYNSMADEKYLKKKFKVRMGKELNLKNPKTFNEKLQWLKLYDRKDEYITMVDKYEVKSYIADKIGEEYIIPTLGVWDKFEDIDFDKLPDQFVLKCTHDSGGLVICKDKNKLDINAAKEKINNCLKKNFYYWGREWPYKNVKPRIIAEEYMENIENGVEGLRDYKFYCVDGDVKYLYVSEGLEDHSTAKISFLTVDWKFAEFGRSDYKGFDELPQKPKNFDKMIVLAKELSKGFAFLRVDLYEINGKVYFSELTFSPCGGFMPFAPAEWDYKFGEYIKLPDKVIL